MRVVKYVVCVVAVKAVPYMLLTLCLASTQENQSSGVCKKKDFKVKTSLVSAFVICLLESIILKLTPSEISLL